MREGEARAGSDGREDDPEVLCVGRAGELEGSPVLKGTQSEVIRAIWCSGSALHYSCPVPESQHAGDRGRERAGEERGRRGRETAGEGERGTVATEGGALGCQWGRRAPHLLDCGQHQLEILLQRALEKLRAVAHGSCESAGRQLEVVGTQAAPGQQSAHGSCKWSAHWMRAAAAVGARRWASHACRAGPSLLTAAQPTWRSPRSCEGGSGGSACCCAGRWHHPRWRTHRGCCVLHCQASLANRCEPANGLRV